LRNYNRFAWHRAQGTGHGEVTACFENGTETLGLTKDGEFCD